MKIWVPGDPVPEELEEHTFFDWVTDVIAIGSYVQASDVDLLSMEGVKTVVSIGKLQPNYPPESKIDHHSFRSIEDRSEDVTDCSCGSAT